MSEKREGQCGRATDTAKAGTQLPLDLPEIVGAEVGEFVPLDGAPHELDRVEVRRITGQGLHREPGAWARR